MVRRAVVAAVVAANTCGCCWAHKEGGIRYIHSADVEKELPEQKYLWMGEELDRPPNLFDVNGQQLALPEVPALIDFEPQVFAADGDTTGESGLRMSRPWGRVYMEGWPTPLQYMRGSFGGPPPLGPLELVRTEPESGCTEFTNAEHIRGKVAVSVRGDCTFGTKAKMAEAAGATGLVLINNVDGNIHPPMPDAVDVNIFVGMLPMPGGNVLMQALRDRAAAGTALGLGARIIPINCHNSGKSVGSHETCQPTTSDERDAVQNRVLGGFLRLSAPEIRESNVFEYLLADFGMGVPDLPLPLMKASPLSACEPLDATMDFKGAALLVLRGDGCDFAVKARNVEAAGAGAMVLYSGPESGELPFVMGALPVWTVADVAITAAAVSAESGKALLQAADSSSATVYFSPDSAVTSRAWMEIAKFRTAGGWPRSTAQRMQLLRELKETHKGHPERLAALDGAYAALQGGATATA